MVEPDKLIFRVLKVNLVDFQEHYTIRTIFHLFVVPLASDCCFSFSRLLLFVACFTSPDFSTRAFLLPRGAKGLGGGACLGV